MLAICPILCQMSQYPLKTFGNRFILLFLPMSLYVPVQNCAIQLKKLFENGQKTETRGPLRLLFQQPIKIVSDRHNNRQLKTQKLSFLCGLHPLLQRTPRQPIPTVPRVGILNLFHQIAIQSMFPRQEESPQTHKISHILVVVLGRYRRVVLSRVQKIFLVYLQRLARKRVLAAVYQQKHHPEVVRTQLITILRSALAVAG